MVFARLLITRQDFADRKVTRTMEIAIALMEATFITVIILKSPLS